MPAWVAELGVAASVFISIAAIWGDRIRASLLRPSLRLVISDPLGMPETIFEGGGFAPARYYRVRVTNTASHPEAREVEVLLIHLDRRGPDGNPQRMFQGALPLQWQHQQLYPKSRTIGRATVAEADLMIACEERLQLTPMLTPFNFPATMRGETHIWVTVVARGLNGESQPLRIQIDWNGRWDRGSAEMATHLVVAPVPKRR